MSDNMEKEELQEEMLEDVQETDTEEAQDTEKKDKKDALIDELTDRYKRLLAEFDNYKKRTEREKSAMYEVGAKDALEKILPVVDNFERGFQTVTEEDKEDAFVVGMEKTYKQMIQALENLGVTAIDAMGLEFDPNFHNAVMHTEDDSVGESVIVEEFQKGYKYKDSVLRYSMVKVAN